MSKKIAVFLVLLAVTVLSAHAAFSTQPGVQDAGQPKSFSSKEDMVSFIMAKMRQSRLFPAMATDTATVRQEALVQRSMAESKNAAPDAGAGGSDYSTTNIQVEGVDELDTVKNDGRYLYIAAQDRVNIIEAFPAGQAGLVSSVECGGIAAGIYVNKDRLAVISHRSSSPGIILEVFNITDKTRPMRLRTLAWEGYYAGSRMIGEYIYLVARQPVNLVEGPMPGVNLPRYSVDGVSREVPPGEIYYFDGPDYSYQYAMVLSVNIHKVWEQTGCSTFLTGESQNIYASAENLYITGPKMPDAAFYAGKLIEGLATLVKGDHAARMRAVLAGDAGPEEKLVQAESILEEYLDSLDYAEAVLVEEKAIRMLDQYQRDLDRERNKTGIIKISLVGNKALYKSRGEVNGQLLNQFSMDEFQGYFRLATTSEGLRLTGRSATRNNIYVLDGNLKIAGKLEGLAPAERIYSARFMGSRAYLVTFRNIDPLFVIDLKNPARPAVLGELKIPGFSDYLHPYDENHLIGVGREVAPAIGPVPLPGPETGVRAMPGIMPPLPRQEGVKIALFDVSNPEKPVEMSKYVVDLPGSVSPVSGDHKAFLFSRDRELMVIPLSYWEQITPDARYLKKPDEYWQGAFIFRVNLKDGIKLRGKVTHGGDGMDYRSNVQRSAYIENVLYTISENMVMATSLEDLKEIKRVAFREVP